MVWLLSAIISVCSWLRNWNYVLNHWVYRKTYKLRFWKWRLWKPEGRPWKFPESNIKRNENGVITDLYITGDEHDAAVVAQKEWMDRNPAPKWWILWCKIFKQPVYIVEGALGAAFGALPRVITGNVRVNLSGTFKTDNNMPVGAGPLITMSKGATLIIDGGYDDGSGDNVVVSELRCFNYYEDPNLESCKVCVDLEGDDLWCTDEFVGYHAELRDDDDHAIKTIIMGNTGYELLMLGRPSTREMFESIDFKPTTVSVIQCATFVGTDKKEEEDGTKRG